MTLIINVPESDVKKAAELFTAGVKVATSSDTIIAVGSFSNLLHGMYKIGLNNILIAHFEYE